MKIREGLTVLGVGKLIGNAAVSITGNTASFSVEEIDNIGTTTFGPLELALVASLSPTTNSGFAGGYTVASYQIPSSGSFAPGQALTELSSGPLAAAIGIPAGSYYAGLLLLEDAGNGSYAPTDFANFAMPFVIGRQTSNASFVGAVSYTASSASVDLRADEIDSTSSNAGTSLRLAFWLSSAPYIGFGSSSGYEVDASSIGSLAAGARVSGIDSGPLALPNLPGGTYYATVFLEQLIGSTYLVDDYVNFAQPFVVGGSNAGSSTIPPFTYSASVVAGGSSSSGSGNASSSPDYTLLSPTTIGVYRFFDTKSGTHFFTSSLTEYNTVLATRPDLQSEGIGLTAVSPASVATDPNATPVYRFFDTVYGTHFFTASATERDTILATRGDLALEGIALYEHDAAASRDEPVYRYFDSVFGTHFFTANPAEKATIDATRPDLKYEGISFYEPG